MNSRSFFLIALTIISMAYGIASQKYQWFPAPQAREVIGQARLALDELFFSGERWYYLPSEGRALVPTYEAEQVQPGFTLITGIAQDNTLQIRIVSFEGEIIHKWNVDWYSIWPDAEHLPQYLQPKGKPGTHIHGSKLMDNGDIVFNFENLGLVRLNACGETVFKLPYLTHHAINVDDNGHFWLPGRVDYVTSLSDFPNYIPPFKDDTVIEVTNDGHLVREISVMKLLNDNGYAGLMYLAAAGTKETYVSGDVYHMNDVEVFPSHLNQGVFRHGDIMVSLRNINTVFIFNKDTLKIRYLTTGKFVRQHDPDFIDGNTISVYDNNHIAPDDFGHNSRIVLVNADTNEVSTYFEGNDEVPFYSHKMGKHQWLENGNLLVLESMNGRVFELSKEKGIVWEYNNIIEGSEVVGIMEGAERISLKFNKAFFSNKLASCKPH